MFEKKEPFQWKIPVLILVGVLVLSSGMYIGVKTRDLGKEKNKANAEEIVNKNSKEVFELMESCEIWVEKKSEDGSLVEGQSMMIGTVPKELLNKSEEEIKAFLTDKYPERDIESIQKSKIVLSENAKVNDPSKASKYSLEDCDGFVALYKYDESGNKSLIEKTQIHVYVLPKAVQNELKEGILVESEEEAYSKLENFGS